MLSTGIWLKAASWSDSLSDMVPGVIDLQLDAKVHGAKVQVWLVTVARVGSVQVWCSLEGAKSRLARPVQPKEPLSVGTVQAIATHFASSASLSDLRFLFILLVGFAGFFRIDEIRNIALRDVSIHSDHISVYVPQRKNDQYREGHTAFLARAGKVTCPVAVTEQLIKLLPQFSSALLLFRRIGKARSKEYFHSSLICVSVSTLREEF